MSQPILAVYTKLDFLLDRPGEPEELLAIAATRLHDGFDRWAAEGVDPLAYNTNESADDIDALRRALGAEKIRLWGTSYGTHLAFATIRRHERQIERAGLLGVEGPDHTLKLPTQIQAALEEVARLCTAAKGDFRTLAASMREFRRAPVGSLMS